MKEDVPIQLSDIKVANVFREATSRVQPLAEVKNIQFVTKNAVNLHIIADKEALQETLVIVLDNAVKYSPPKSTITLSAKKDDTHTAIEIADKGTGIAPVDLPHIFDRFYRTDSARSKSNGEGHGLGLSIARQLIERQGGTISAKSAPKKGTTIQIVFPTQVTFQATP